MSRSDKGPDTRHTHRLPAEDDKSRRSTKRYALNGGPGLVERRKPRQTGTFVSIYRVDQTIFAFDVGEPWALVCEAHETIVEVESLSLAKDQASDPTGWCEQCERAP